MSKENRENRGGYSSGPELTRILPACPPSSSPGPSPILAPRSRHPSKTPPPPPHLHFVPPSTLFQTSGFKSPDQQQPTFQPWWTCCAGGAGPPHTRITTGGQAGGRPARGAVIVRVDSCQSHHPPLFTRRLCPSHTPTPSGGCHATQKQQIWKTIYASQRRAWTLSVGRVIHI